MRTATVPACTAKQFGEYSSAASEHAPSTPYRLLSFCRHENLNDSVEPAQFRV
eukprot:COSAG03_NODE_20621_length_316_cov_0.953917_1_plen_52_part_01